MTKKAESRSLQAQTGFPFVSLQNPPDATGEKDDDNAPCIGFDWSTQTKSQTAVFFPNMSPS
jgi:hypothetical protein